MAYFDGPRPRLFAHRGASGTFPENTIEAFEAGLAAGADRLELDVHGSADGQVVVFHDESLERTTDGAGLVRQHTLADLREYDAGYRFQAADGSYPFRGKGVRIPTLDEVLERFPHTPLNIEIKQEKPHLEHAVVEAIDRARARDRVLLAGQDQRVLERVRRLAPDLTTSFSALEVAGFVSLCQSEALESYAPPAAALQVPARYQDIEIVTPAFVDSAHELGLEVHVWTVNDETEMLRLLDLHVDAVMSDYPAKAWSVYELRGLR
ncbi:MAG: glycerophosphodiester phosphodiesterase [Deltaproteobacteria bacterium]|nr:glycerophosphodiester phosphodiesterase [Deltaproteobacteria bacterium]